MLMVQSTLHSQTHSHKMWHKHPEYYQTSNFKNTNQEEILSLLKETNLFIII